MHRKVRLLWTCCIASHTGLYEAGPLFTATNSMCQHHPSTAESIKQLPSLL